MKIICISDAWLPQINGVVRTYQNIAQELHKLGHEFTVIGPSDFKFTIPAPTYPEIKLVPLAHWSVPKKLAALEADIIHIATEGPLGRAARAYCLRSKRPFTTCYHTRFPEYLARRAADLHRSLETPVKRVAISSLKKFHARAALTMLATQSLENELTAHGYKKNFHRFVRGIHLDLFYPGEKTLFNDLPRPIALYVGRVAVEKNIESFLDANWTGSKVVVGDGPALADLKRRYPHVHFAGSRTGADLAAHYRSADIFVFPSKTDTFGIVLIEALASGLPVAAYPVMGPIDIITEPFMGALHKNLETAMQLALSTPGDAARRATYTAQTYTWQAAAEQFLSGLKKAVA